MVGVGSVFPGAIESGVPIDLPSPFDAATNAGLDEVFESRAANVCHSVVDP